MKRLYAGLLALLFASTACSQSNTFEQFTQIAKGFDLTSRWSADLRSELRLSWIEDERITAQWTQLYLQGGIAYQLGPHWIAGATYRLSRRGALQEPPKVENRLAQQISGSQRLQRYRIRGRLMLEQRIFPEETVHRWRLRVAADYPLNGDQLDPGEWYLNHQAALLIEPFEYAVFPRRENRLYTGAGALLGNGSRLEFGLEARLSRSAPERHQSQRWVLRTNYSM